MLAWGASNIWMRPCGNVWKCVENLLVFIDKLIVSICRIKKDLVSLNYIHGLIYTNHSVSEVDQIS